MKYLFTSLISILFIAIILDLSAQIKENSEQSSGNTGISADSATHLPKIIRQPKGLRVAKTSNVMFSVDIEDKSPYSIQWKKNGVIIKDATSRSLFFSIVQLKDTGYYHVEISNAFGTTKSDTAKLDVADNFPPNAMLINPTFGNTFSIGDTIRFLGGGNDFENGILNKSSFLWKLEFHQKGNIKDLPPKVIITTEGIREGYFVVPNHQIQDDKAYYRLSLTVRDQDGFTDTKYVDITPKKIQIKLLTNPPGLKISLDGSIIEAPYSFTDIAGTYRNLASVPDQIMNGIRYRFDHWEPIGLKDNFKIKPGENTIYTAVYTPVPEVNKFLSNNFTFESKDKSNNSDEQYHDDITMVAALRDTHTNVYTNKGYILREFWTSVRGTTVDKIPHQLPPNGKVLITQFEGPENLMDNYGTRISGYIYPPASGTYYFWIASDEQGELWLSKDDSVENKAKIAYVPTSSFFQEWSKFPEQKSEGIYLEADKKYYIEALHKESLKIDHISVGWRLPDGTLERPIPGKRLSPFITPYEETENIELIPASGVDSIAKILAYMDPADKGTITLSLLGYVNDPRIHILVFDTKGKKQYNEKTTCDITSARTVLPIKERFKPGVYVIQVAVGNKLFFERILIR
ncbi:PKD domain-containing protein [Sporocytophaga myxococcoides]|uniref:PKD domain-containing protein n=1 Tax=Sporocytophaga myxococcoides TaxID=153721 RepID=A0A098LBR9_9BACT|nr:PA14 domain-containing protein [Sporocytophaga myxococcoides]GAL84370.1 PKD domain-containing protein [Sporocytophaga myxococcoides]